MKVLFYENVFQLQIAITKEVFSIGNIVQDYQNENEAND